MSDLIDDLNVAIHRYFLARVDRPRGRPYDVEATRAAVVEAALRLVEAETAP